MAQFTSACDLVMLMITEFRNAACIHLNQFFFTNRYHLLVAFFCSCPFAKEFGLSNHEALVKKMLVVLVAHYTSVPGFNLIPPQRHPRAAARK